MGMMVITVNILILMHAYLRRFHLQESEKMASFFLKKIELRDIEDLSQVPASSREFRFEHIQSMFFIPQSPRKEDRCENWGVVGLENTADTHTVSWWHQATVRSAPAYLHPSATMSTLYHFFKKLVHSLKTPADYHVCFHLKCSESI